MSKDPNEPLCQPLGGPGTAFGQGTPRPLGPAYWYGGPWLGISLLHAVKER